MARLISQNGFGQNGFSYVKKLYLVLFLLGPPTLSMYIISLYWLTTYVCRGAEFCHHKICPFVIRIILNWLF